MSSDEVRFVYESLADLKIYSLGALGNQEYLKKMKLVESSSKCTTLGGG